MWETQEEMRDIINRIENWNEESEELFKISMPNENMEFFGVVRFYFHGPDDKYHSKCVRISSLATARHLVNVLVEKFHPDLRLLKAGKYALYEYHPSSGERRLTADERPLVNQLYWSGDSREGQFLLRDEARSLPTPGVRQQQPELGGIAKWRSAGNLLGESSRAASLQPNQIRTKDSVVSSSDELFFPTDTKSKPIKGKKSRQKNKGSADEGGSSSRRWTAKKSKKEVKGVTNGKGRSDVAEQAVIRTASLPDFLENEPFSAAHQRADAGGTLTIFLGDCGLPDAYRQLKSSPSESARQLINRLLAIYGLNTQAVANNSYCLQQINIPPKHERLPLDVPAQVYLRPDDRPLQIMRRSMALYPNIRTELHLMNAEDVGAMGDDYSSQQYVNLPQQRNANDTDDDEAITQTGLRMQGNRPKTTPSPQPASRHHGPPCLVEVNEDGSFKQNKGLQFVLLGLVQPKEASSRGGTPIKIGSSRNAVGPTPNILIDSSRYPDIRPVHCSLLPNTAATRNGDRSAVLISPALDISSRPPGLAPVFLNGRKVTGPTPLFEGAVIRLGRNLNLRYIEQAPNEAEANRQRTPHSGGTAFSGSTPALAARVPGDVHQRSATLEPRLNSAAVVGPAKGSAKEYKQRAATVSSDGVIGGTKVTQLWTDQLPICVDIILPDTASYQRTSKSEFAAEFHEACCDVIDAILEVARNLAEKSAISAGGADTRLPARRPPLFVLTPAFMLYAVLRSCLRRWRAVKLPDDHREHYLTGVLNHIGSQVFQSSQTLPEAVAGTRATRAAISHMMFWLANASELLNFIRNDEDIAVHANNGTKKNSVTYRPDGPSVCDGVSLLERSIDFTFHELQNLMLQHVEQLMPSILFPGDYDLQDDVRLDDRPRTFLSDTVDMPNQEASVQRLLQALSYLMLSLRQACVNVSFAFQLFAAIFHALGAWIFNAIIAAGEGKQSARGRPPPGGALWLTRLGAGRLMRRLQRMKQWADRHGLEQTFEGHFQLPIQTCLLITCDRSRFQPFQRRILELRALNSKRIEWLLGHLGDPPALPQEWLNSILKSAREELDTEQVHAKRSSRGREILTVREDAELKLPLLIPPSGYAATSGLTGIPDGFMEAIDPLVQDGYIRVRRNEAAYVAPLNGKWTGHLVIQDPQDHSKTVGFGSPLERGASQQSIAAISKGPSMGNLKHEKLNIEKLARRVGVKLSSVVEMVLKKANTGLGLSIVAAKPEGNAPYGIYVRQVVVGGAAERDGRLETGDQILAIQNCPLIDCDQSEAVKMLAHNSSDQTGVHMVVAKRAAQARGILSLINSGNDQSPVSARRRLHAKGALTGSRGAAFGAMTRSTPCLNLASDHLGHSVSEEDDSDDSEDSGPRFGSRILPRGAPQTRRVAQQSMQSVSRHKSLEMLSSRPVAARNGPQRVSTRESEPSTDDLSDEGSDHVWRQSGSVESLLNQDHVDSAKQRTESLKKVGVELPVTKSQLQQFNRRRQQKNNSGPERTDQMPDDSSPHQRPGHNGWQNQSPTGVAGSRKEKENEESSSPDWSDFARQNAEAKSRVSNKSSEKEEDSPSPSGSVGGGEGSGSGGSKAVETISNTSEDSFIARKSPVSQSHRTTPTTPPKPMARRSRQKQPNESQNKREDDVYSLPSDEAVYAGAQAEESSTTESEDLHHARQRIVSGGRGETEKPVASEAKAVNTVSVSDKALQTSNDFIAQSPEKLKQAVQTGTVPMLNSAVQTEAALQEPVSSPSLGPTSAPSEAPAALPFYRPPLDRLSTSSQPTGNVSFMQQPQISVETVSNSGGVAAVSPGHAMQSTAELKTGRFQQPTASGPAEIGQLKTSASPVPKTEFNLPWGGPYPSPAEESRLHGTANETAQRHQAGPPYMGYLRSVIGSGGESVASTSSGNVLYWTPQGQGCGRSGQRSPSPPPVPTADFPQYHPPAYLEPAEWPRQSPRPAWSPPISPASKWPVLRAPAFERSGSNISYASDSVAVVHGPPASHSLADPSKRLSPSREVSPRRPEGTDYGHSSQPPAAATPRLQTKVQPKPKPKSWIRADGSPMFTPSADIIDGFEKERLEIIRMQEQRARMHEEQFNLRPAAEHKPRSGGTSDVHQFSRISPHADTNPTYENCSGLNKYSSQSYGSRELVKSRESVALSDRYSGQLVRGGDLRWSKKSVTFDEQPATVSVYTPPGTPHESLSEGALTNRDYEQEENKRSQLENRPLNVRPQRHLLDSRAADERFPRSTAQENNHSRIDTQALTSQTQVMNINHVQNAENLPFKEKMKLFAQAIGEEEPKNRIKASSRELHLLKTVVR
nr:unnamed protein product [Spirometra erinaceieuropaei]